MAKANRVRALAPLANEYPFLRRLWLRELRAVRLDHRAGRATFGDVWRATKTATALRYCAGLGLFPCDPATAPHVAVHTSAAIARATGERQVTRAASAVGPVTVRAEGVRLNGKPVCNRFAIEYPNGIGHIEFSDESAAAIERAVNSHDELLAALATLLGNARLIPDPGMAGTTDCYAVPLDDIAAARAAIARATGVS